MHPILDAIYRTATVTDGIQTYSALNAEGHPTYMDAAEGALLQRVILEVRPSTSLEIGLGYGVSTLHICEALAKLGRPRTHIVMDPFQSQKWHAVGLHNIRAAGFADMVRFFEERSEFCLPRLVQEDTKVEVALIDGAHIFEQCALEFYYIDCMLQVGGVVIFDDVNWAPIRRVVRLVLSYGTYRVKEHTGATYENPSLFARARKVLRRIPRAQQVFRPDFLERDWELGIGGSCVALEKISPARRTHGDYRDF